MRFAKKNEASEDSSIETEPVQVGPVDERGTQPCIDDTENLRSVTSQRIIQETYDAIRSLSLDDRAAILEGTMGQAENKNWHLECAGRLTASVFKKVLRSRKPDDAVRGILYPRQVSTEAMR
ncbi:hypothetical protein HPB50_013094 [Hyalomma asiaticum]|uniref:Uncharacterized protein n=1 Tax=Hyalomma asiaticum TaxID=266040 RepID=A0ACB7SSI2_HYAAI|nr:hypothetical protein HPB50_013094 [Hyalomma asiaticum]